MCSAVQQQQVAGCRVPLAQAGPRDHTQIEAQSVRSSPARPREPGRWTGRLRKVVVGLAGPDTRRSPPCHGPRRRQGRPSLWCLTASRGSSRYLLCPPPCSVGPGRTGAGDDGSSSRVGVIYLPAASWLDVMGWDGMGWDGHSAHAPSRAGRKPGLAPMDRGDRGIRSYDPCPISSALRAAARQRWEGGGRGVNKSCSWLHRE